MKTPTFYLLMLFLITSCGSSDDCCDPGPSRSSSIMINNDNGENLLHSDHPDFINILYANIYDLVNDEAIKHDGIGSKSKPYAFLRDSLLSQSVIKPNFDKFGEGEHTVVIQWRGSISDTLTLINKQDQHDWFFLETLYLNGEILKPQITDNYRYVYTITH
ncbi:MAG: hypothetical protein OCD76_04160 [Reichenbachiella sp.]